MKRFIKIIQAFLFIAVIIAVNMMQSCKDGDKDNDTPKGPDDKPLAGSPGGTPIPDEGRNLNQPNSEFLRSIIMQIKAIRGEDAEQKRGTIREGETTFEWEWDEEKKELTIRYKFDGRTWTVKVKSPAPEVCQITMTAQPYGYAWSQGMDGIFIGHDDGCTDLVWVQYIKREATFKEKNGNEIKRTAGPEIDEQVPYRNQGQFNNGGGSYMEDGAGPSIPLGTTDAEQAGNDALNAVKTKHGLQNNNDIVSVVEKWTFWTYLVCLKPEYKVLGHFDWSFEVTIDPKAHRPIVGPLAKQRGPTWVGGE